MKLQLLVGTIASAKTTYAKNAAKEGFICLNDDDVVTTLHGGVYGLYSNDLKIMYKSVENHIATTALSFKRNLLVDRGLNVSKKARKRWLALASSFDVPCEAVLFAIEAPEVHAQRRFNSDNRGYSYEYWLKVANSHIDSYQEPTLEEGFNKIYRISFDEIQKGRVL